MKKLLRQIKTIIFLIVTNTITNLNLQELLNKRNLARKEKNWAVADEYRNKLSELGYKIVDNKDGSSTLVKKC